MKTLSITIVMFITASIHLAAQSPFPSRNFLTGEVFVVRAYHEIQDNEFATYTRLDSLGIMEVVRESHCSDEDGELQRSSERIDRVERHLRPSGGMDEGSEPTVFVEVDSLDRIVRVVDTGMYHLYVHYNEDGQIDSLNEQYLPRPPVAESIQYENGMPVLTTFYYTPEDVSNRKMMVRREFDEHGFIVKRTTSGDCYTWGCAATRIDMTSERGSYADELFIQQEDRLTYR